MKVALFNAFPNLSYSAEREFIERCLAVLAAQGVEARSAITSDELIAFDPDLVIVTHEFVAKTTDHFTAGLLWSPTRFYRDDPARLKAIRSWDLVVPINGATRRFARNLHFPLRHDSAVSELDFFPSAPDTPLPLPDTSRLSLAYVGAHWDGQRHRRLLEELAAATDLHVYGPEAAWSFLPGQYRGPIPFDGRSLVQTLHRHGVVLALHKLEHVEEQTPSMRVFEGCAARCAVITEPMPGLVERFGDALNYLDTSLSPRQQARSIAAVIEGYRTSPASFERQVTQAHGIFSRGLSLERLLQGLVEDVSMRRTQPTAVAVPSVPEVTVIVRCGSRPLAMVQRAVDSLARQTHPRIGLLLVRFAALEGLDEWAQALRGGGRFGFVSVIDAPGGGVRSAAMWAGLGHVRSELFCLLDDDDELFADHLASLVALLQRDPGCDVAYSGVVKQEEDGLYLNTGARFKGDRGQEIPERRELRFMDDFDLDRLLRFDNFIQSNTWLARSRVLDAEVLADPQLEVGEDMYFYLLLASRYRFRFSGRVSAVWNWRSNAADNSMLAVSQARWARCGAEVIQRLSALEYPGAWLGREVLGRGRGLPAAAPAAADGHALPRVAAAGRPPSAPRSWIKRALSLATGRRVFVAASDPLPFDAADVVCTIDFTQPRWPEMLVNARGLSDVEPWGCWTDGPLLTLEFRSPLPPRFRVHLVGHAHPSQHQRPLVLAVGSCEATLRMSARLRACRHVVALQNPGQERSLVLRIPDARSPAATDPTSGETRRLGVGLVRMDIVSG